MLEEEFTRAVDKDIVLTLRNRTLPAHGGNGDYRHSMMHHWNLTLGDSYTHRAAADEIEKLRNALKLAQAWGLNARAFDSGVSTKLSDWIEGGCVGAVPPLPDYLKVTDK